MEIRVAPLNLGLKIGSLGKRSSVLGSGFSRDPEWDIYDTKGYYLKKLKEIPTWKTTKSNIQSMLNFLSRMELEGIGVVQRTKYIHALTMFVRTVKKDFNKVTPKDLEFFLHSLSGYKPKTKEARWTCLKKFLRYIDKEELYKGIDVVFKEKGMKLPEELLTQDEVKGMVNNAMNLRDKAMISVLYESGCRIGEMLTRRLKHVAFDEYGGILTIDGKTGMRRVRLIQSVPLLATWVDNHPIRNNPEAFLWINLNNYTMPAGYGGVHKMLKENAARAGIKKQVYPHLFRHSRATHLANDLTEQQLKIFFGWTGDSRMASIYVHLSGKDVDNAILELNGLKPREKKQENGIKECPRCGFQNSPYVDICNKCGSDMVAKKQGLEAIGLDGICSNEDFQTFLKDMFRNWKHSKDDGPSHIPFSSSPR